MITTLEQLLQNPTMLGDQKLYREWHVKQAFDLATAQQAERLEELEDALKTVHEKISNYYDSQCNEANWYNNNMPRVGQSLDYKPLPPKPISLEIIDNALNKSK